MRRYYFHLHECGKAYFDSEGQEFADLDDAVAEAVRSARDVMASEVKAGRLCLNCCIIMEDKAGREVGRLQFRDALVVQP